MSKMLKSLVHPFTITPRNDGFIVTNGIGAWISKDFRNSWATFIKFSRKFPKGFKE